MKLNLSFYQSLVHMKSSFLKYIEGSFKDVSPKPAEFLKWTNPTSIIGTVYWHFRNIKMKTWSWSAYSIEPGQTAQMCRLALLYTGGKSLIAYGSSRIRVKCKSFVSCISCYVHVLIKLYIYFRLLVTATRMRTICFV